MFQKALRDLELFSFVDELLHEECPSFRRRMVAALSHLNAAQWDALEAVLTKLAKELTVEIIPASPQEPDPRPRSEKPVTEWTEADIDADVEEYRRALLEEKRRSGGGSASAGPSSSSTA